MKNLIFIKKPNFMSFILSLTLMILVASCGSGKPKEVALGKEFEIGGKKLKIEKIVASTILSNDEKKVSVIAPEGKKYVYFKLSNPEDKMVFIKAKSNGTEVKTVTDGNITLNFKHESGKGIQDAYFLVNEGQDIDFEITTPSSQVYNVAKTDIKVKNDREILPEMKELLGKYKNPINLLKPLDPYVEGKVIEMAKEKGKDVPTSPMTKNMKIEYIFPDGTKYMTSSETFKVESEITWKGGKISDFEFSW